MPWSDQDASGESPPWRSARRCGGCPITPASSAPASPSRARSAANTAMSMCAGIPAARSSTRRARSGCAVTDWQNVILVNMLGKRFYDETGGQFTYNTYQSDQSLRARQLSQRQERRSTTRAISSTPRWPASATASNGGGPIWAIFDADGGRAREMGPACRRMSMSTPASSSAPTASTSSPAKIEMKYQRVPMPPRESRGDGRALQLLRRCRQGCGFRQAQAALQDRASRRSTPPGRRRWSTIPAPACASTRAARSST